MSRCLEHEELSLRRKPKEPLGKESRAFQLVCQVEAAAAALLLYLHRSDRLFEDIAAMTPLLHLAQACCHSWRLMHTEPNPFELSTIPRRRRRPNTKREIYGSILLIW